MQQFQKNMLDQRNMLLTLQISVLGIVVVFGLFWILRSIRRIEDKLQFLTEEIQIEKASNAIWNIDPATVKEAEKALESIFENEPSSVIYTTPFHPQSDKHQIIIDDDVVEEEAPTVEVVEEKVEEVEPSEADTESENKLSRTKIKKMTLEQLRVACFRNSLSEEGTRKELMERLLVKVP